MKKLQVWLPLLFAVIMILGMRIGYKLREKIPASQGIFKTGKRTSVQEVMDLVRLKYVDQVDMDSLSEDAIEAMLGHLDPHSVYIPATHLSEVNEDLQGNFQGIGVEFQIIADTVHVVSVLPGGPSDKAGLKVGDRFVRVADSSVAGVSINSDRIKSLLRGEGGTVVPVVMKRGANLISTEITRGTIPLYSVDASYMMDSTTGYIHLNKFSSTSYEEFMQALEGLQARGMKKLIFDLRDNGGGILGEAVDISDEFLDEKKMIVFTDGASQKKLEYHSKRPGLFETGKLAILVDEGSASASEVVAGALQDWDRATIVGRRTFGKGLVQEQYPLASGAALRLTVARYYTPTGRSIQKSYSNGLEAYHEEVLQRFNSGEMVHPDTVKIAMGKAYKTKGGRTVYGGGGITPDVFVPFDTTVFTADLSIMFKDQQFSKFIYTYYIQNKSFFDAFKNPADYATRFADLDPAYNSLIAYMQKQSVSLPAIPEKDKTEIKKRIKTWMARQIWRMQGYYEVNNRYDNTVSKAIEEVSK